MEDEEYNKAMEALEAEFTPEELIQMSDVTHRMAIMIGVKHCGTIKRDTLCAQIYADKNEMIPLEQIVWAYDNKLNLMLGQELLFINDEWTIHPDLVEIVNQHQTKVEETIPSGTILN